MTHDRYCEQTPRQGETEVRCYDGTPHNMQFQCSATVEYDVYGGWARSDTAKNVNPDDCATDPVKCGGCSQELQDAQQYVTGEEDAKEQARTNARRGTWDPDHVSQEQPKHASQRNFSLLHTSSTGEVLSQLGSALKSMKAKTASQLAALDAIRARAHQPANQTNESSAVEDEVVKVVDEMLEPVRTSILNNAAGITNVTDRVGNLSDAFAAMKENTTMMLYWGTPAPTPEVAAAAEAAAFTQLDVQAKIEAMQKKTTASLAKMRNEKAEPSSFLEEGAPDSFADLDAKLKALEEKTKSELSKLQADTAAPSSFVEEAARYESIDERLNDEVQNSKTAEKELKARFDAELKHLGAASKRQH
jgi:hypothetical protein